MLENGLHFMQQDTLAASRHQGSWAWVNNVDMDKVLFKVVKHAIICWKIHTILKIDIATAMLWWFWYKIVFLGNSIEQ